jgi:hypothetical protein
VRLNDTGTVILAQDAVWIKENLEGHPAGLNYSILSQHPGPHPRASIREGADGRHRHGHPDAGRGGLHEFGEPHQDDSWMEENLEGYPAGLNYSILDYTNSVNRLKMMRDIENAPLWLGHSIKQYEEMGEKWYQ